VPSSTAFNAGPAAPGRFSTALAEQIGHVMVTAADAAVR